MVNPVTERTEPFYSDAERMIRYLESFVIISVLLFFIFIYLVAAYNITGVIEEEKWNNIFYIPWLADMAKEGAIFDVDTNMAFIPSIGQTVITMILNSYFRDVAKMLTDRENHKYQNTYDNSLIIKRFSFEFYDCFLPLIYLGWWELNFKLLRQAVISLYVVDEIRRVAVESLLPYLTQNKDKIGRNVKRLAL